MALLPEVKRHYGKLKLLIDGEWVESKSTLVHETVNPATGEVIAEFPTATTEEARAAVEAAQRGFEAMKKIPLRERAKMLFDMRQRFEERFDELTRVLTQDHGRTIKESIGSVRRVIENIESACSAAYGLASRNEHMDALANGIDMWLTWEPMGAFLIVTPGNIPMHAWSSFVPYALAAGCSVVVSPSRQDPVAAEYVARAALEAGWPNGAINLIHGGREINKYILRQPEIQGLGFIGSTHAGWELFKLCGELGKNSSINGNGKNTVVIMPDANVNAIAPYLRQGCFGMTGQRCLGSDNVVVVGDIYDELKKQFTAEARAMKLGYGLDESTAMGPYCTAGGRDKVDAWVQRALAEGATMVQDGRILPGELKKGFFMAPTIIENVHPDMEVAKEEAFGAVAALIRAESLDQVIEWINTKTDLGHSACIMTESGRNARKFAREVNVGNVGINVGVPQPFAFFPLGSKRKSFFGGAKSRMASMRLFLDEKTVTARWV
ncbi:aldehyde dehydrogenase family protein [Desulfomonile tiedjei]|uniref:methylmalonate-semialdehyde dehydrogenase (CoA acylating) n=1 Tax=Desulfomonile tiedjei (strain ATCC 49306 / DSM 6799 / DCB-1) TaxID=706587 RepID=I4C0Q7_DESTA|nr:aldehyde dehydrogenase family protein [Desulfomonile tiedjei]AFM23148.1 NAD-dependent aldehyde dehydrogenase [Desulfomonile tiedjei DSM 6799]